MTPEWIDDRPQLLGKIVSSDADTVCISRKQRDRHVFWETAALVVVVPFSVYLALNPLLAPWARLLAGAVGGATLAVDGALLREYRRAG